MREHRKEWPLKVMCRVLEVSRSGYYAWTARQPSARFHRRATLSAAIHEAHATSRKTYGSPRVTAALKKKGVACCVNTVARIMRKDGLAAKIKRRFKVTTDSAHDLPTAPNRLDRCFRRERPNQAWVSDITFIATDEGWLYLATEMDLYSRKIVGWAMSERLTTELVSAALSMAIAQRRPPAGLLHHSDRGSQYASQDYQALLTKHQIHCSMSRAGNCYDNAPMESFFGTLKTELVHHCHYQTKMEAKTDIFEYIEVFYNRFRRHSALQYQSPVNYENSAIID